MSQFSIPLEPTAKNISFFVQLEGITYEIIIVWNVRESAFFISILRQDGQAVLLGRKIVSDLVLFQGVMNDLRPFGELYILDSSNKGGPPQLNELGSLFKLLFFDLEEIILASEAINA